MRAIWRRSSAARTCWSSATRLLPSDDRLARWWRGVVGEVDKAIAVFGDRTWTASGETREPARFVKMPLRWERTAGGSGTTNPVGVRMGDVGPERYTEAGLPNLQATDAYLVSPADVLEPAGFGPIAPRWPGRIAKLHRHAAEWDAARWSERPLPDDVDSAFFNVAPGDQQVGGDPVRCANCAGKPERGARAVDDDPGAGGASSDGGARRRTRRAAVAVRHAVDRYGSRVLLARVARAGGAGASAGNGASGGDRERGTAPGQLWP